MNRVIRVVGGAPLVLVTALLLVSGCGSGTPAAPAPAGTSTTTAGNPSGSPSGSASPTSSASDVPEFSVDGAGPYTFGAKITDLQAAGKLDAVTAGAPGCPDTTTARGTGKFADLTISFHKDGTLYLLVNKSPEIPTPSGVYLGTSLADLNKIYANVTKENLNHGTDTAFLVITITGKGILFNLSSAKTVLAMTAGDVNYLRMNFVNGTPYC